MTEGQHSLVHWLLSALITQLPLAHGNIDHYPEQGKVPNLLGSELLLNFETDHRVLPIQSEFKGPICQPDPRGGNTCLVFLFSPKL